MLLSSVLLGFHYEHSDVSFSVFNQLSCPRPPDCLSLKMFYNAVFFSIFTIFSLSFGCHVCESYNHSLFPSIVNFQVFFRFLFFFFFPSRPLTFYSTSTAKLTVLYPAWHFKMCQPPAIWIFLCTQCCFLPACHSPLGHLSCLQSSLAHLLRVEICSPVLTAFIMYFNIAYLCFCFSYNLRISPCNA